jgi:polar amino acid transport system substrate-binding protein
LDLPAFDRSTASLLASSGVLRVGINLSNFLLVSSRTADGGPAGVSPDMAAAVATAGALEVQYITYPNPGALADAATRDEWDIALIGAEPQRAETIAFTSAYAEIEATCIVPDGSPLRSADEIDVRGRTIALAPRTAWGLWLERNVRQAELVKADTYEEARALFLERKLDALGGLRPKLIEDVAAMPGMRLLDGRFMTVQQAIGVPRAKAAAAEALEAFVRAAMRSGFVASLIAKHGVTGLTVANQTSRAQPAPAGRCR